MKAWMATAAFAATALLCAAPASSTPNHAASDSLPNLLKSADDLYQKKDYRGALVPLKEALASPEFPGLGADVRITVLTMESFAALESGDNALAIQAARAATDGPGASEGAWLARYFADVRTTDAGDALATLTVYTNQWPDHVSQLGDDAVWWALRNARGSDSLRRAGLVADEALYDANWRPKSDSFDDELYRLAVDLLARGDKAKANAVIRQIKEGRLVLEMSIDHRFDAVNGGLDPVAATKGWEALTQAEAAAQARSLAKFNVHLFSMVLAGDGAGALAGADRAIAQARASKAFDDQADQLVWTLNRRSEALNLLGRHDEALRQMADASRLNEQGRPNVSQVINLGDELYHQHRPAEALSTVAAINASNTSPYGLSAVEEVRACAAAQLNDRAGVSAALAILETNKKDNPYSRFEALLCAGDLEQAAAGLIAQLADPDTRGPTLVLLQDFADPPQPLPSWQNRKAQIAAVRLRPDVRRAIDAAGSIHAWPFPAPDY